MTASLAVLGCSVLHLVALSQLPAPSTTDVVALLGMAMICLPCVPHLLLDVRQGAWMYMGLVSGGMLARHSLLHYFDGGHAEHMNILMSPPITIGMSVGPGVTLVLAMLGLNATRRARWGTA